MENAAKATKETTGSETKAEIAVLKGTRDVMDNAVKKGLSDADMASVTENANEQMNGIAKAAKDAGAQGDGLAEIAKVASGQNAANAGNGANVQPTPAPTPAPTPSPTPAPTPEPTPTPVAENSNNVTPIEATKADQDGYIWKIETNKPVIWINPQPCN